MIIAIFTFFLTSCQTQHTVFVKFEIDDKTYEISDDFEILFAANGNVERARVSGSKIELPELDYSANEYDVTFIYHGNRLEFKSVNIKEIQPDQDITWEFRIDNPPFYENYEGVEWDKVKRIHYWSFDPHEFGVGIEIIEPVF